MNEIELPRVSHSQKMVGNIPIINKNIKARKQQLETQECMLLEE